MKEIHEAIRSLNFKWLPKRLNHITENIVFKNRNISFLAINALFRSKNYQLTRAEAPFEDSFVLSGFIDIQTNDKLRTKAEELNVIFRVDTHKNIIVITAYSDSDE
jgi:hypothetical protein